MMPRSAKGKGKKRIERRPIPIPPSLERSSSLPLAIDRPAHRYSSVLTGKHGTPVGPTTHARSSAPWPLPAWARSCRMPYDTAASFEPCSEGYRCGWWPTTRHQRQHDRGLYAKYIGDHSDTMVRAAQIDLAPTAADPVVVPLASRRP